MLVQTKDILVERAGSQPLVFDDFEINGGENMLLLGPSGSGKTTLLSVLAGLLKPSRGSIKFNGVDIYDLSETERDHLRGNHFGFIFQTLHLIPSLSLFQNVALAEDLMGKKNRERIEYLLDVLGLADKAHRKPDALSQGEQQRAAIARAVLNKPAIIIADEPTSALDDVNTHKVMELLEGQAKENGSALLIATHDNRISNRFDKIIHLKSGVK